MHEFNEKGSIIKKEKESEQESTERYFQVDLLKALMIILVIFDHSIPWVMKNNMGVALWERISIPVFLVILGFNQGTSFQRENKSTLKELFSLDYFKTKFWRFLVPFLLLYVVSTIVGLVLYGFNISSMFNNQFLPHWGFFSFLLLGILPFWGPGNWFIPVLFQALLIMPLLYKGFSGKKISNILTLGLCFLIEIATQLFVFSYFGEITSWNEYFISLFVVVSVLFHLSAIGLGMWFSRDYSLFSKRNRFMWILFPLSALYLVAYQFLGLRFGFIRGDYNYLVYPYSAFLFLVAMTFVPNSPRIPNSLKKGVRLISRSTYHILLAQILYFGILYALNGTHYYCDSIVGNECIVNDYLDAFIYLAINWAICVPIGILWFSFERYVRKRYNLYRNSKLKAL